MVSLSFKNGKQPTLSIQRMFRYQITNVYPSTFLHATRYEKYYTIVYSIISYWSKSLCINFGGANSQGLFRTHCKVSGPNFNVNFALDGGKNLRRTTTEFQKCDKIKFSREIIE